MLLPTRCFVYALLLSAFACSTTPSYTLPSSSITGLLDGAEFLTELEEPLELVSPETILSLDNATKAFAEQYVNLKLLNRVQLDRFSDLLFEAGMLGLRYELDGDYTAQEAFDKRRGNCLSVALLATALLRDSGTKTYFQEAYVAPTWGQLHDDNSVVVTRHVNVVALGQAGSRVIIEFDRLATGRGDYLNRRRITDRQAFAHYYNNLGVKHIAEGRHAEAFLHIRRALELSPKDSHLWSNLGVLYRRTGHLDKAGVALLHAINLDRGNYSAMTNLVALYQQQGKASAATVFSKRAERWRYQNPYYRYARAKKAFEMQDFTAAQAHLSYVIEALDGRDDPVLKEFSARVKEKLSQPK